MKMEEEGKQVDILIQRSQLIKGMSGPLYPCVSTLATKRIRGDDRPPFPCPDVSTKRVKGDSCEGSFGSRKPPMSSSLTDLPDILTLEILLRLPLKSILRCKSLCKRCCFLISSYYPSAHSFCLMVQYDQIVGINSYHRRFQVISDHPSLREVYRKHNFDISFLPIFSRRSNEGNCEEEEVKELWRTLSSVHLEASCDCWLLCSYTSNKENEENQSSMIHYFICNVVSRQYVALPPAPAPPPPPRPPPPRPDTPLYSYIHYSKHAIVGFICEEKGIGVPRSDNSCGGTYSSLALSRYMVVCFPCFFPGHDECSWELEAHIFSSETACWTKSVITSYPRPRRLTRSLAQCGRLLAFKDKLHLFTSECIAVFDPFKDRERFCRIVDLPAIGAVFKQYRPEAFGVSGNRLRVASVTNQMILC